MEAFKYRDFIHSVSQMKISELKGVLAFHTQNLQDFLQGDRQRHAGGTKDGERRRVQQQEGGESKRRMMEGQTAARKPHFTFSLKSGLLYSMYEIKCVCF